MNTEMRQILQDAKHAILWLSNQTSNKTKLPRTDIVEAIEALLKVKPGETWCKHCERWRDESACRADPYINAEPRTYCPVPAKALTLTLPRPQSGAVE